MMLEKSIYVSFKENNPLIIRTQLRVIAKKVPPTFLLQSAISILLIPHKLSNTTPKMIHAQNVSHTSPKRTYFK